MARTPAFSGESLSFEQVYKHHSDLEAALIEYYVAGKPKFIGYTLSEVKIELETRKLELDRTSSFSCLSSIEAAIRMDYLKRCHGKRKDELSLKFRDLFRIKGESVSLEEDILEIWKQEAATKALASEIKAALKYRHWLAHGRYWVPKLGKKYDFTGIYNLTILIKSRFGFS